MSCSLKNCPAHVLNAGLGALSYFPLSLWSWQDTVKPVFLDRVNVASEYDRVARARSWEVRVPSIIFLKACVSMGRRPAFTRFNLFLRDAFNCQYRGGGFPTEELTFDHIVARSRGGKTL